MRRKRGFRTRRGVHRRTKSRRIRKYHSGRGGIRL